MTSPSIAATMVCHNLTKFANPEMQSLRYALFNGATAGGDSRACDGEGYRRR